MGSWDLSQQIFCLISCQSTYGRLGIRIKCWTSLYLELFILTFQTTASISDLHKNRCGHWFGVFLFVCVHPVVVCSCILLCLVVTFWFLLTCVSSVLFPSSLPALLLLLLLLLLLMYPTPCLSLCCSLTLRWFVFFWDRLSEKLPFCYAPCSPLCVLHLGPFCVILAVPRSFIHILLHDHFRKLRDSHSHCLLLWMSLPLYTSHLLFTVLPLNTIHSHCYPRWKVSVSIFWDVLQLSQLCRLRISIIIKKANRSISQNITYHIML